MKKIFVIRLILFTIFACLLPFVFIAYRYNLFKKVSELSLSGWGLVAIIIVFLFSAYIYKMIKKGLPYSMFTQCLTGVCKIIVPLVCLYLGIEALKNSIDLFSQALLFCIICELIAIPLNPFPKWVEETKDKKIDSVLGKFVDKLKGE